MVESAVCHVEAGKECAGGSASSGTRAIARITPRGTRSPGHGYVAGCRALGARGQLGPALTATRDGLVDEARDSSEPVVARDMRCPSFIT